MLQKRAAEYLLIEQPQRRQEIENLISRIEKDMRYGMLATAVFWGWFGVNSNNVPCPFDLCTFILPIGAMLLFYLRWCAFDAAVKTTARYMKRVERRFRLAGLGWEINVAKLPKPTKLKSSTDIWWPTLVFVNLLLPVLYVLFVTPAKLEGARTLNQPCTSCGKSDG